MSNNNNEPGVYLNGKPCNISEFSVSDDFLDAWLAEEPTSYSAGDAENKAISTGKPLQPGDYIPGDVRESSAKRLGLGDVVNVEQSVAREAKGINE